MESPPITIVTIARNALADLQRTVESVRSQLDDATEYLIIDGASTDGTVEYLAAIDQRGIRSVSEPDAGISDAMNKGIWMAKGEWVMHLHAGDTLLPGALSVLHQLVREYPTTDFISSPMVHIEDFGVVTSYSAPERLPKRMSVPHPGVLSRRQMLTALGGFDTALRNAMDYDLFLRAWKSGAQFVTTTVPVSCFAGGGQSELSLWNTLWETRNIRRRVLNVAPTSATASVCALWVRGQVRIALKRIGVDGLVARYRKRFTHPRMVQRTPEIRQA
jgi:glycosyltransferase involved in cell wall biosynthesis